jgi:hypothetical protein
MVVDFKKVRYIELIMRRFGFHLCCKIAWIGRVTDIFTEQIARMNDARYLAGSKSRWADGRRKQKAATQNQNPWLDMGHMAL